MPTVTKAPLKAPNPEGLKTLLETRKARLKLATTHMDEKVAPEPEQPPTGQLPLDLMRALSRRQEDLEPYFPAGAGMEAIKLADKGEIILLVALRALYIGRAMEIDKQSEEESPSSKNENEIDFYEDPMANQ